VLDDALLRLLVSLVHFAFSSHLLFLISALTRGFDVILPELSECTCGGVITGRLSVLAATRR